MTFTTIDGSSRFSNNRLGSVPGSNQESPGLVAAGSRWMKRVNDATELPEGVLSVQLFVPDMFGNDVLLTR